MKTKTKKAFRKSTKKAKTLNSKIKYEVSKALNSKIERKERRYEYTSVGGTNGNNTGTISAANFSSISYGSSAIVASLFAGIATGTIDGNRIGSQIVANSININLNVQNSTADSTNYVRLMLIRPRGNTNMSSIANFVSQVLNGVSASSTNVGTMIDTNDFKIYYDKCVFLKNTPNDGATSTSLPSNYNFNFFMRTKAKIQYDQTSGYPDRDFFLIAISDSSAVPNPGAVNGFVKLTFQDA